MGTGIGIAMILAGVGTYLARRDGWVGLLGVALVAFGGFGVGHEALLASLAQAGFRVKRVEGVWRVGRIKPVTEDPVEWL